MTDSLLTRYRPNSLDEVVGQDVAVKQLARALQEKRGRAYMFSGGSGCGKTTLAGIAARSLGCAPENILEIDAVTHAGVDEMREVTAGLQYQPLGGGAKCVVVNECQGLSSKAWDSVLVSTEHPPPWAYWMFTTTDPGKVPKTLMTRCLRFDLKPVARGDLMELLAFVCEMEKWEIDGSIIDLCVKEAEGSPRQALSNLGVCAGVKTRAEAAELLRTAADSEEAVALARALASGAAWDELLRICGELKEVNPESIRHVVRAYLTAVVLKAKSKDAMGKGMQMLDAFSSPFHSSDGISPVLLACGRCIFPQR